MIWSGLVQQLKKRGTVGEVLDLEDLVGLGGLVGKKVVKYRWMLALEILVDGGGGSLGRLCLQLGTKEMEFQWP